MTLVQIVGIITIVQSCSCESQIWTLIASYTMHSPLLSKLMHLCIHEPLYLLSTVHTNDVTEKSPEADRLGL